MKVVGMMLCERVKVGNGADGELLKLSCFNMLHSESCATLLLYLCPSVRHQPYERAAKIFRKVLSDVLGCKNTYVTKYSRRGEKGKSTAT